jgi:C1A family cysteine protease
MIRSFGWIPDSEDKRDRKYTSKKPLNLPSKVDFRDRFPQAWNQGTLGSCTAHAVGAACLYQDIYDSDHPITVPSLLYIYYMTRALEGTIGIDAGATIRNTVKSVVKFGYPLDDLWPYKITDFRKRPDDAVISAAAREKVSSYERIDRDLSHIREILSQRDPIVFGFTVFESIYDLDVERSGIIPLPKKREKVIGGHAVLACGYDDERKALIIRNSWGKEWGEAGYGYLPYGFIESSRLSGDFWIIKASH